MQQCNCQHAAVMLLCTRTLQQCTCTVRVVARVRITGGTAGGDSCEHGEGRVHCTCHAVCSTVHYVVQTAVLQCCTARPAHRMSMTYVARAAVLSCVRTPAPAVWSSLVTRCCRLQYCSNTRYHPHTHPRTATRQAQRPAPLRRGSA